MPVSPVPDFEPAGDSGDRPAELAADPPDEDLCELDFDPDSSPPDGAEAWLADVADPVRNAYLDSIAAQAPAAVPDSIAAGFLHRDGGSGRGFAAGGLLDVMAPGPVLAGFADDAWADGLDRLTDDELIGVICAWRRLASWSAAGEFAAVSALARRRAAESGGDAGRRLAEHVDSEIAAALTLTSRSADRLLELAAGLGRLTGHGRGPGGRADRLAQGGRHHRRTRQPGWDRCGCGRSQGPWRRTGSDHRPVAGGGTPQGNGNRPGGGDPATEEGTAGRAS